MPVPTFLLIILILIFVTGFLILAHSLDRIIMILERIRIGDSDRF